METTPQAKLKFSGVDFFNVSFNAKKSVIAEAEKPINLNFEPRVYAPKEKKNEFKILAIVKVSLEDVFDLNIHAVGHFELSDEVEDEAKKQFINLNAVAILFPYIRAFITNFTTSLGGVTGPITIPVQFFDGEVPEISDDDYNEKDALISSGS